MVVYSLCIRSKHIWAGWSTRNSWENFFRKRTGSVDANPNSTSFPTKSAGEVACLAAKPKRYSWNIACESQNTVFKMIIYNNFSGDKMILDELHSPIVYWTIVGWEYPSSVINLSDTHVFRLSSLAIFTARNRINK